MTDVLISTLDKIPNYTITETKGVIHYAYIDFQNAISYLKNLAQSNGCNAVINLKCIISQNINNDNYYDVYGDAVKIVKTKDENNNNEKGLKKESIEFIIERGKCSREQAIKALKECNGDVTEALLSIDLNK